MRRRQLTKDEILRACKDVAMKNRIAERSAWTAMGIMCGYSIMKSEGFKQKRLADIAQKVSILNDKYLNYEIELEDLAKTLMDKAEWTIEVVEYTDNDIISKKKSFDYFYDKRSQEACNKVNNMCMAYLLFFFNVLITDYEFGKVRLTRVKDYLNDIKDAYEADKEQLHVWKKELLEAGVMYEGPKDPLFQ